MEIKYLERCNRCEMNGKNTRAKKALYRDSSRYPCFFAAFYYINRYKGGIFDIKYRLHIKKEYSYGENNFAVMPQNDMRRFLNSIKMIIPFKYGFESNGEEYLLHLHLRGTGNQHKALLMFSRALFEFPHNVCALDALQLRSLGTVDDIDYKSIPLYNIYINCLTGWNFSEDESIIRCRNVELLTTRELKEAFADKERSNISNKIHSKRVRAHLVPFRMDTDAIYSDKDFKERVEVYSFNYKERL